MVWKEEESVNRKQVCELDLEESDEEADFLKRCGKKRKYDKLEKIVVAPTLLHSIKSGKN